MCDYSLESRISRPAVVGEKLVTHNFGGTQGFKSVEDKASGSETVAVCLLPGTEIAFDENVKVRAHWAFTHNSYGVEVPEHTIPHAVARFCKINPDAKFVHHDGLEFPDQVGQAPVTLHSLTAGQTATVLQLPADIDAAKALDEATRAQPEPVF